MTSLTIIAKRWFNTNSGNTYYSAYALIDGKPVQPCIDYSYGYGSAYADDMFAQLELANLLPTPRESSRESPSRYCSRNNIAYTNLVTDVTRKRDL